MFGHLPGYPPGSWFEDRRELAASGVHRPLQAGICGRANEGAESIVLNGGYIDDQDLGSVVLYTGAGGNDPGTRHQVRDQKLNRWNLALATSLRVGLPVRVIRGSHPDVHSGPATGYRYDGLYRVDDYWPDTGIDGYRIWRFRLEALENSVPPSYRQVVDPPTLFTTHTVARHPTVVSRIIRDTSVTRGVKKLYRFRCQVCRERIETPSGPYAEAAHIRPLGRPHNGPDVIGNALCLCPTHHAAFDLYAFTISDDGSLIGTEGRLHVHPDHNLDLEHLQYHRTHFEIAQQAT
ncbi:MAG: YDG/SRA domain-containing protein [Bacteroidota bacterium]